MGRRTKLPTLRPIHCINLVRLMDTTLLPDLLTLASRERPFTVDEYHRLAEAGVLTHDDRVELLDGRIITMSPIGSAHLHCVNRLIDLFAERLYAVSPRPARLSVQNPIRLNPHSEPEPDVALLRSDAPQDRTPIPEDVLLVVEVADSTLTYDRTVKQKHYAAAGIPEYWVVDLNAATVIVHRQPQADGYGSVVTHHTEALLTIAALPDVPAIPVEQIV